MSRQETSFVYVVGKRRVEVKAYDSVGVDDCYENAIKAVLHKHATGEDWMQPVPREIKDWIIRTNLTI